MKKILTTSAAVAALAFAFISSAQASDLTADTTSHNSYDDGGNWHNAHTVNNKSFITSAPVTRSSKRDQRDASIGAHANGLSGDLDVSAASHIVIAHSYVAPKRDKNDLFD